MNGLLQSCLRLNVGAIIGKLNVSCLGYCDDLLLLKSVNNHMDILLKACFELPEKGKLNSMLENQSLYNELYNV